MDDAAHVIMSLEEVVVKEWKRLLIPQPRKSQVGQALNHAVGMVDGSCKDGPALVDAMELYRTERAGDHAILTGWAAPGARRIAMGEYKSEDILGTIIVLLVELASRAAQSSSLVMLVTREQTEYDLSPTDADVIYCLSTTHAIRWFEKSYAEALQKEVDGLWMKV